MSTAQEILERTQHFSPKERAAAIAHWVYITTAQATKDWNSRVPEEWDALSPEARKFNMESIETWAHYEEIMEAWFKAVKAYQESNHCDEQS